MSVAKLFSWNRYEKIIGTLRKLIVQKKEKMEINAQNEQ